MALQKCPVCDWEITEGGITVEVNGKPVLVCCDDCAKKAREEAGETPNRTN